MSTSAIDLMPGDVALAFAQDQLKTLLGSCVSVILTDPKRTVAAMCHIVHVGKPGAASKRNTAYGVYAMEDMFAQLRGVGVTPKLCEAYVFGGGNMFPHLFMQRHVGSSNIEWVLNYLHQCGIKVVDTCLGGNGYRRVSWTVGPTAPLVETVFAEQESDHGH